MRFGDVLKRGPSRRAAGGAVGIAGLVFIGLGTAGVGTVRSTAVNFTLADPGCSASTPAPGTVTVCLKEAHEGSTALGFSDQSCDNITNRDTTQDYFVFVLPTAGDPGRGFTAPAPTVTFDTGGTTGTIDSNTKFFFASAPPGSILEEASGNADNGSGTPTGGEDQVFNLTHTCPAVVSSSTTTSSTTTGTGSVSGSSTTSSTTTSSTTTGTGSVSGSSTTSTTTTTPSTTTASTASGSISITTTTTTTASGGGQGITTTPNTGADVQFGAGLGLLLLGGGLAFGGSRAGRRKRS